MSFNNNNNNNTHIEWTNSGPSCFIKRLSSPLSGECPESSFCCPLSISTSAPSLHLLTLLRNRNHRGAVKHPRSVAITVLAPRSWGGATLRDSVDVVTAGTRASALSAPAAALLENTCARYSPSRICVAQCLCSFFVASFKLLLNSENSSGNDFC